LAEAFRVPSGGETVRAFLIFGLLFAVIAAIYGNLSFRQLDLQVMARSIDVARAEAQRIADVVSSLGWHREGIDFHRLRQKQRVLEKILNERMDARALLRFVEVRDRFGARLTFVARGDMVAGGPLALYEDIGTGAWDDIAAQVIRVPLRRSGIGPAGEVRVGLAEDSFRNDLENLRRNLRFKATMAATGGVVVLILGFVYVLYLLRKNRRLEQSRLAAERRSYVGLLASGLAHEIRNPLNAMNMNLQMLEEELQLVPGIDGSDTSELLDFTKSEIKRLERLVNNFLAYARPSRPNFEPKDLNAVIQEICRFLQADLSQANVEVEMLLQPLLPSTDLDETQFKQAVMNLLVNAKQVVGPGGNITIKTRAGSGGEVVLEIQDDGPGIDPEAQERIFEVFYSSRGGGTGLGLPIARQVIERHGGSIEVESEPGRGATFRIRLPRRHPGGEKTSSGEGKS
jgi:signal transduction histidine kinase